jgi:hypothetical protein
MEKENQICEMAVMGCRKNPQAHTTEECIECGFKNGMCDIYRLAEMLYTSGYRKERQGEWIKVYENKVATVYECSNCKHLTFGISEYCVCGAKMKGAE